MDHSLIFAPTVDVDEHVLGGALPQPPQAGHAVQGPGVMRLGSVDGETLHDVKGDGRSVHGHLRRGKLPMQGHPRLRRGHLTGQEGRPVGSELNHLVMVRRWNKQLLRVWVVCKDRADDGEER